LEGSKSAHHRTIAAKAAKSSVANAVSKDVWQTNLDQLSGVSKFDLHGKSIELSTRYTYSDQCTEAAEHIKDYFTSLGLDEVYFEDFQVSGSPAVNVVGVLEGTGEDKDEIVVVGAHYDSISQDPKVKAPGAVDNGSGAAGVMAIAAASVKAGLKFSKTLHFVTFGGEEQGLWGSIDYVKQAQAKGRKVAAALCMDMICYSNRYFGVKLEGTRDAAVKALVASAEADMKEFGDNLTVVTTDFSFGSDHVPFQEAGIPAFLAIERDDTDYHSYHRTTDVAANCNADQSVAILRGLAATMCDAAGAQ